MMDFPRGNNTASSSTFQLDVSSLGAIKLKDAVKAKLSEFMGSYTDDVLAEYVVVLVGHGKRQSQAIDDLEAFLGDQSTAFVSWLWEHLSANEASYVNPPANDEKVSSDLDWRLGSSEDLASSQKEESGKLFAADGMPMRNGKDSGSRDPVTAAKDSELPAVAPRRVENDDYAYQQEYDQSLNLNDQQTRDQTRAPEIKRNRSPEPWSRRGRGRVEDRHHHKRDNSPPRIKVPRRLLESAVRDAVAPGGGSSSRRAESGFKRLRSVVLADVDASNPGIEANGRHQQIRPRIELSKKGNKVPAAVAVALKAAAAAAEDVNNNSGKASRGRVTGSVWDRLGSRSSEKPEVRDNEVHEVARIDVDGTGAVEDRWVDSTSAGSEEDRFDKRPKWRKMSDRLGSRPTDGEDGTAVASDFACGASTGYHKSKNQIDNHWPSATGERIEREEDPGDAVNHEDGRLIRYGSSRGHSGHDLRKSPEPGSVQLGQSFDPQDKAADMFQEKYMSVSPGVVSLTEKLEDVDTAPDLRHELLSKFSRSLSAIERTTSPVETNDVLEMKKRMRQVQLEMTKLRAKQAEVTKEVQKIGSGPGSGVKAAKSHEEINAHSVCVANIHFAATKEAIAAHFSPCGEIVRVTLLTDGATGKPKGSAYVEFASKESVENALNLNDSSLLSRTLKVLRKDATADSIISSPAAVARPAHQPPFLAVRAPPIGSFLRGGPPPVLRRPPSLARPFPGTAHLQWKRETSVPSPGTNGSPSFGPPPGSPMPSSGRVPSLRSPSASMMGDRYGHGPIRTTRSMSYVRPTPYTPREAPPAVQEQKVAN